MFGGIFDEMVALVSGETAAGDGGGVQDQTLIPGEASTPAKHSPGALPNLGGCNAPLIVDPLNPSFCIPDPKKNYSCPSGQIFDYVPNKCVPYRPDLMAGATPQTGTICPYGTKAVGKACVSLVATGTSGGASTGGQTTTPTDQLVPADPNANGVPTWVWIAGGAVALAAVGGAVYVAKKKGTTARA